MSKAISKEILQESVECFAIFSKNGILAKDQLGTALRSLGFNPTNAEVAEILKSFNPANGINLEAFKKILQSGIPEGNTREEIREAFGIFDRDGNGTISATELRHILKSMGEKLTDEEIDAIIKDADINPDGYLHYEQFVHLMTTK